jgi:hypothetical protein
VCRLELGDLITVRHFPPGGWSYSVDLLVQGIVHRVTPSGWAVELATGPKPAGDAVADPQPPTDVRAVHASASTLSVTWTPAAVNNETGFRVSVDTGGTPTVIEVPAGSASAVISCPANLHANVTVTAWNAAGTATSTRTPVVPHVTPTPLVSVSFLWPLGAPNLTYDATWSPDPATACPQCGLTNDYRWPVTITDPSSTVRVDTHTVDPVRTITGQTAAVDGTWRTVVHLIDQVGTTSTTVDTVVNPPTATARPPAPLGVRLDFTDPTRLTVIWNDPANPAAPNEIDAIEILVRTAATDYGPPAVSVAWTGATGRTWSFPNPLPDTDYHVTVRTRNEAGTGDTVVSGWTRPPVGTVKVLNARWIDTWTSAKGWRSDATYYAGRWSTLYETQQIVIGWGTNAVELCRGHHPAKVEIVGTRAASGGMTGAKVRIAGHANASTTKPATIPTPVPPWQENALVQPVAGATATGTLTALDRAGMATGTITGLILAAPDTLQANYSVWSTLVVKVTF